MIKNLPFISIIIANYNGKHLLKDCLDSLHAINYPLSKFEVIIVDNASQDNSKSFVQETYPSVKIIENNVNNYCQANNLGILNSQGEFVAFLNNDTIVDKNWLIKLIKVMEENDRAAAVGSKILLLTGKIQSTGHIEFPNYYWGDRGFQEDDNHQYDRIEMVKSVSNCSVLYRKKALMEIGMFDEDFVMYMEDVDASFRLREKGWEIFYAFDSKVFHKLHGSIKAETDIKFNIEKNRLLFIVKYFPDKLAESLYGNGEIINSSVTDFHRILIAVYQKLIKHHGAKKADAIFKKLNYTLQMMDDYKSHCFLVELGRKTDNLKQEIAIIEEKNKAQSNEIIAKDSQLHSLNAKIKIMEKDIENKEKRILQLSQEILNIYESETYRLIVKPFIWPVFFSVKNTTRLFRHAHKIFTTLSKKQNKSIVSIAQFYSKSVKVSSSSKNEYYIKLVNTQFKAEKIKLIIDIWPHFNRNHPERHFAYFAIEVMLNPRSMSLIKITYDWDKDVECFIDNHKQPIIDFWRGTLNSSEFYAINAHIYNLNSAMLDESSMVQMK